MNKAAIGRRARSPQAKRAASPAPKKHKLSAFLVTGDVDLWPQVGAHLTQKLIHRQIDSVDELLNATPPGQPGVVLWDARECADQGAELARLHAHSASFAIIARVIASYARLRKMSAGRFASLQTCRDQSSASALSPRGRLSCARGINSAST